MAAKDGNGPVTTRQATADELLASGKTPSEVLAIISARLVDVEARLASKPAVKGKMEATAPTHTASKVEFIVKPPPWTTNAGVEKQTYRITIGGLTANCKEDRYQRFVKVVGLKAIHLDSHISPSNTRKR